MKKLAALILVFSFLLSGCGLLTETIDRVTEPKVSENSSVVKFTVYPEANSFQLVDKFDRPEYQALSDTQQKLYILLDNAIYDMQVGYFKLVKCTERDIELAYNALTNDRPEYFWLPKSYKTRSLGDLREFCLAENEDQWLYTKQERQKTEAEIKTALNTFLKTVDKTDSEYTRELKAHDWLCEKITYDSAALADYDKNFAAWSVVGALVEGKAVCEGYSRAMQMLCFMLGLDCTLVIGKTEDNHMWNAIRVDGDYYHVDLTANDGEKYGTYRFFFNVTTEYLKESRTVYPHFSTIPQGEPFEHYNTLLPSCTEQRLNYHIVNSQYIGSKSSVESTVVSLLCDAVRSGKKSVEFAVSPDMEFVFGKTDAAKFFNIEHCIAVANSELSSSQRIRKYSYGGVNGALGFRISW